MPNQPGAFAGAPGDSLQRVRKPRFSSLQRSQQEAQASTENGNDPVAATEDSVHDEVDEDDYAEDIERNEGSTNSESSNAQGHRGGLTTGATGMSKLAVAKLVEGGISMFFPRAEEVEDPNSVRTRDDAKTNQARGVEKVMVMVLFACILLVVVLLAVFLPQSNNDAATNLEPDNSTLAPSESLLVNLTREEEIQLLLPDFTVDSIVKDSSSPQAQAYEWLIQDPWLDFYPDWRIRQRFALATYY